jgi:glycosyltransferase 2 family protein
MTRSQETYSVARAQNAGPPRSDVSRSTSKRTVLVGAVVGLPVSVVLLLLSLRHLDTDALGASLRGADPWALALAVCAMSLVYLTQAARWRLISKAPAVPLVRFAEWVVGAIAVNNVVPGRPGDLLRVEWLSRGARMPRTRALATVAVDRGLDVVTLVAALALTYPAVHHASWLNRLWIAGIVAGVVLGMLFVAARVYARRGRVSPAGRLRGLVADFAREAGSRLSGWRGVGIVMLSALAWGTWALSAWLVTSSLGIALTPLEVVFVTGVLNLGVAIPSSPGFIGTYQWLAVSALGVLGVAHADAFAFSVLMHAAWFVPTTLAGAVLALRKLSPAVAGLLPRRTSESHAA